VGCNVFDCINKVVFLLQTERRNWKNWMTGGVNYKLWRETLPIKKHM